MTDNKKTKIQLGGRRVSFEEIALGHSFKLIGTHSLEGDDKFHCAFCGGRGRHFCLIERDDGETFKVGANCLQRVGLVKKASTAKLKKKSEPPKPHVERETAKKKLEDKDVSVATDVEAQYDEDFFDEILKELEN